MKTKNENNELTTTGSSTHDENLSIKTLTAEDKEKNTPKRDNEDDPESKPAKKENDDKPAIDPGDPEIKPSEKEKTKEKIPVNHPGNKGL